MDGFVESKEKVEAFLENVRQILTSETFDLDLNFDILPLKRGESGSDEYTTLRTMAMLDFEPEDVVAEIVKLSVAEYSQTLPDKGKADGTLFYEFYRAFSGRDVYIKIKIRERASRQVFCISFHFARYPKPKNLPYA